ncbi:hypothetical protein BT96DRAFT_1009541 [Gymnopus androsaceus JB14]|uniref:Uncharacterized protein n=1 Tax=Gymnopus androsaceus JB14 TaxID=1447944 RepID=A0A6A4GCD2_9AGAR|nr:hypothetical protein BT96DRAFT_1009541 [Gymnopus androsaceus JB14]
MPHSSPSHSPVSASSPLPIVDIHHDRESSTTPSTGGGVVDDGSGSADFDDPFDAINQLVDARLQVYSPLGLSIVHFRDLATPLSPADEVLHVVREVAAKGRNSGLWVTKANGEVATSSFVARIDDTGNKVGPIGDLDPYQNRVDPRDLRRVKARISLCSLDIPYGASEEEHALISEANDDLSKEWALLLSIGHDFYKEQEGTDRDKHPTIHAIPHTDWVVEPVGKAYYNMVAQTRNFFDNCPAKTSGRASIPIRNGVLVSPEEAAAEREMENLRVLETTHSIHEIPITERTLGHWPDPKGHLRAIARQYNLNNVRCNIPEVYDKQNQLIHPMDYPYHLFPGAVVFVTVQYGMWNMINDEKDPKRHCYTIITKLRILPDDPDDVRALYLEAEVERIERSHKEAESMRLAEEMREQARVKEVQRLEEAKQKAEREAAKKKERLEAIHRRAAGSSPSVAPISSPGKSATTSSTGPSPTPSPTKLPSSPSNTRITISPLKRPADGPPETSSPSLSKAPVYTYTNASGSTQTWTGNRLSSGRKPPKVVTPTPANPRRSQRHKGVEDISDNDNALVLGSTDDGEDIVMADGDQSRKGKEKAQ